VPPQRIILILNKMRRRDVLTIKVNYGIAQRAFNTFIDECHAAHSTAHEKNRHRRLEAGAVAGD